MDMAEVILAPLGLVIGVCIIGYVDRRRYPYEAMIDNLKKSASSINGNFKTEAITKIGEIAKDNSSNYIKNFATKQIVDMVKNADDLKIISHSNSVIKEIAISRTTFYSRFVSTLLQPTFHLLRRAR